MTSASRSLTLFHSITREGHFVSACATCDGFFYRNKKVVVVGGGNTAVEEALYLANIASEVTLVHRRDTLRAERIMQDRLFRHPKVKLAWNSEIDEICGTDAPASVTHVRTRNVLTGAISEIPTDGVFVAIGHRPATDLFVGQLELTPTGFIKTDPATARTSTPMAWAAGDCADERWKQAIYAAGMGCIAALDAERLLAAEEAEMRVAA